jgi:hypothetical protein
MAIRAACQGIVIRGSGSEAGNVLVPSGSRIDLFVDVNQYGGPVSMNSPFFKIVGTGSALNSPEFPVFNRGATLLLDLVTDIYPVNNVTNSVGISRVINDTNVNLGAIMLGVDPSLAVDSHSTSYLGNLGSNQPIFDYWPRFPMFDDTAIQALVMEDADEEDNLYQLAFLMIITLLAMNE